MEMICVKKFVWHPLPIGRYTGQFPKFAADVNVPIIVPLVVHVVSCGPCCQLWSLLWYLAIAPMTPPTSSFLNLSLASIRLRQICFYMHRCIETDKVCPSNSFALYLLLYLTCQLGQRRRGQEQEQEKVQSWRWPPTAAPGDSALQKPL